VDLASGNEITASEPIENIDEDGFEWMPDGTSLIVRSEHDGVTLLVVNARLGVTSSLGSRLDTFDAFARPPDGRQVMLVDGDGVSLLTLVGDTKPTTLRPSPWQDEGRIAGWTPDGSAIVIHHPFEARTAIVDLATGATTILPVGFGHVSNDGTRVVGLADGLPCVMALTDIRCKPIGGSGYIFDGGHLTSVMWSPDDRWILVQSWPEQRPLVLDPAGDHVEQPVWIDEGWDSWQRVAP